MKQPQGNGSGRFNIHSEDMGGWVRVFPDRLATIPDDLGVFLSQTLANWFRQHPALIMRCVVPICRDGTTMELHAWFDAHLFPQSQAGPQPLEGE